VTQQGARQASYRTLASVTAGTYDENVLAAAGATVAGGVDGLTIAGAEIQLLQTLLGSSKTSLDGMRAEYAAAVGATSWGGVGTVEGQT